MSFAGFKAGFFGRGQEVMAEKRAAARRENEIIVRGIMDGVPQLKERKKIKRQLRQLGGQFKTYNLSDDEIGTILRSGNAENILKKMRELDSLDDKMKQKIGYDPANVVKFHDGYESSGLTLDQHIDSIVGKLNTGMNLSDALIDSGSKPKTSGLGSLFEPNRSKMLDKRLRALRATFGDEVLQKARAVQQDDITYGDDFRAGTINIPNPVLQAQVKKSLTDSKTGLPTAARLPTILENYAFSLSGGSATGRATQDGVMLYTQDKTARRNKILEYIPKLMAKYDQARFTSAEVNEIKGKVKDFLIKENIYIGNEGEVKEENGENNREKITDPVKANEKVQTIIDSAPEGSGVEKQKAAEKQIAQLLLDSGQADNMEQAKRMATKKFMEARKVKKPKKTERIKPKKYEDEEELTDLQKRNRAFFSKLKEKLMSEPAGYKNN